MQPMPAGASFVQTDFSDLVAAIYDAAVMPSLWSDVLESCRSFVGGASAGIFAKNISGSRCELYFVDGRLDPERTQSYFDGGLSTIDPSNTVQVLGELEQAVVTSSRLAPEDFLQTRFAREWATPLGLVDMVVAPIERRGSWAALFGVFRHEKDGLGDDEVQARVSLLAPHIRRSIGIGKVIGSKSVEAQGFRETIDGLSVGVLLVDADGRVVHANAAGSELMGMVPASTNRGTLRLDRSVTRDLLPASNVVAPDSRVLETSNGDRYVANILPLTGPARQVSGGGAPVAALFLQKTEFDLISMPKALADAFDLTPAELRVALAALHNDRVADMAEELGVAEPTVKTHLSRIFAKTDTRRQADIVKLAAGFASPLRPRSNA